MTEVDFEQISSYQRYKLMASLIVPRPIALVTTLGANGVVNAAPFSMFNMIGEDPPILMISINRLQDGRLKDTAANIAATGEFVVNLVPFALAEAMNITAIEFAAGVEELAEAGLTPVPSIGVRPPRIAECPAALECRLIQAVDTGGSIIQIGRVLHLHVRDDLVDVERTRIHTDRMDLIGRMHGGGWYARTTDLFDLPRVPLADWVAGTAKGD
jgi:flavin reductase (DIM6/NTAB) family NADH-FMN oxidoreductase RutF